MSKQGSLSSPPLIPNNTHEPTWKDRMGLLKKVSFDADEDKDLKDNGQGTPQVNITKFKGYKKPTQNGIDKLSSLKSFNRATIKAKNKSKLKKKGGFGLKLTVSAGSTTFADKLATILCNGKQQATVKDVLKEFSSKGIQNDDPRVKDLVSILKDEMIIDKDNLITLIKSNMEMMQKIYTDDFCVKKFSNFSNKIKKIYNKVKEIKDGAVASYIPQLAKVNSEYFGVSICTIDGQRYNIGDCDIDFCIQSCCKIINYCIAYEQHGDAVHTYVGKEPSGVSFNALALDTTGKPHNPCINAGAIMTCSLINNKHVTSDEQFLQEYDEVKQEEYEANRFDYLTSVYSKLCNGKIGFNNSVYLSERATGHRNYALGHFMKEQNPGFPPETNLTDVLEFYFQCCSLDATVNKLSILAGTLATGGTNPVTSIQIFSPKTVKNCLSLMNSCGMYDYSGEFAFSIGIPSKSGVGGGIISVIPGLMGISIFSPKLDKHGNSVRGVEFLKRLGDEFHFHHFDAFDTGNSGNNPHILGRSTVNLYQTGDIPDSKDDMNSVGAGTQASTVLKLYEHNEISLYRTILYASSGDLGGLKRLYLKGYSLYQGDYDKRTPLHLAASNGHIRIVIYLSSVLTLNQMNPKDRWENTPYQDAIREGHSDIAKFLEKYLLQDSKDEFSMNEDDEYKE